MKNYSSPGVWRLMPLSPFLFKIFVVVLTLISLAAMPLLFISSPAQADTSHPFAPSWSPIIAPLQTATVATSLGVVTFAVDGGVLSGLTTIDPATAGCATAAFGFPYGYFSFTINNLTVGQVVTIVITLPNQLPMGSIKYYKCINGNFIDVTELMSQPDPTTLILTIRDGGLGDADGIANGRIVDPGGPCMPLFSNQTPTPSATILPGSQGPAPLPNITVKKASLSATKVSPGAPVTVTATVSNSGTANGTALVRLYVNGQEEAKQGTSVQSGGITDLKFTVTRSKPGLYNVYVGGVQAGQFRVDAFADPNTILLLAGAFLFIVFVAGVIIYKHNQIARQTQRIRWR